MHEVNYKNENPLVSVVMVAYNGQDYIADQLHSILHQTYQNIEIIILDNASTDQTVSIIENAMVNDKRIQIIHNYNNTGPTKGFEKAMQIAEGSLIAPCDQDDVWELNKLEVMMGYLQNSSEFLFSRPGQFTDGAFEKRTWSSDYYYRNVDDLRMLIFHTPISGHATLFRKELLNCCTPFPDGVYWDWWITIHAVLRHPLVYVPYTLTWQRIHSRNVSLSKYLLSKKEQLQKVKEERLVLLQHFFATPKSHSEQVSSILEYFNALQQLNDQSFSVQLFLYALKNRKYVFHYKKKKLTSLLSHVKHAFRFGKEGV